MTPLQTLAITATLLAASNLFLTLVPFAMPYVGEGLKWDYLWAAPCLVGAVLFIFRG